MVRLLLSTEHSLWEWIPYEFVQKPRGLDELPRLKATELRLFRLYIFPVVFQQFLPPEYLIHFNTLHSAMRILHQPQDYIQNNECAKEQLKWIADKFSLLYGEAQMVYRPYVSLPQIFRQLVQISI